MTWDLSTVGQASPDEPEGEPTFVLEVLDGAEKGKKVALEPTRPRVLVGKSPACDLCLTSPHVSRRHAAFELTDQGVRLTDLDSSNGTMVGDIRVREVFLRGGERVGLAGTTLRLCRGDGKAAALTEDASFGKTIGKSAVMRSLYPLCKRLAESDLAVLLEGETGTGKEVLAESLHEASRRAAQTFVVCDCTAVPPSLAESTLFGHEKGAFTGAVSSRKGVFEEAHGGTLFIDEIGELELATQPKLLRALERGEVQRVGSNTWVRVDVRIIAATRRNLDREVQSGRFRDDLFFRLAVGRVELPPLRDRKGDVPLLVRHFTERLGGTRPVPPDVLGRWMDYPWPGNLRELHNAVARFQALGDTPESLRADAGVDVPSGTALDGRPLGQVVEALLDAELPFPQARERVVDEFERRYVERVFARHGGNVLRAAAASGIARRYFQILRARHK